MPLPQFVTITNGWPSIEIGRMRHPITVQAFGSTSPPTFDDSGVASVWSTFVSAMAAMDPVRGTDVIRGGQTTSQVFIPVAMWFQAGIVGGMRVVTEYGNTYIIQSVDNVLEMNVVLILNCIALGPNE